MARVAAALIVLMLIAAGYILSPFVAAWTLREAIKAGDTETLERKVVWASVRSTLRSSIANSSQLLPEATLAGERVKPTMWQRLKAAFGQSMLDRFIESYVTPEGLPKLFRYRKGWNGTVKAETDDEETLDFFERAKLFYRRMTRAEFKSLTRIEIEMIDKFSPDRRYLSVLELHGIEWKLAELHILAGARTAGGPQLARDFMGVQ